LPPLWVGHTPRRVRETRCPAPPAASRAVPASASRAALSAAAAAAAEPAPRRRAPARAADAGGVHACHAAGRAAAWRGVTAIGGAPAAAPWPRRTRARRGSCGDPSESLREKLAGYPAFLAPGSRKKPDPVALKSISVGNRGRSTDPAARRSGPNRKHHSKPPERAPTIADGRNIQDLGRSVARRALHVRRSSAPQCVIQIAGAWAAFPPPDAHS